MITLYTFAPFLGTPDSSPFVMKAMLLLKFAGLAYQEAPGNPLKGPNRLLPYIEDEGLRIADFALIRRHIERKYRIDFDAGLSARDRAAALAAERMCEDHLYFAMLHMRWADDRNFANGLGRHMFGVIPAPVRPLVKALLRRMNGQRLAGHGLGRHPPATIAELAIQDIDALAELIGDKPFLMGDRPCGADAFVFGIIAAIATPELELPIRTALLRHRNLIAYRDRLMAAYFAAAPQALAA